MKQWRISMRQGVVLVEFEDGTVLTPEMLLDIYRVLNADPQKYRTTNVVYDLRNTVPDKTANVDQIVDVAATFKTQRESWWKHEKTALVASTKVMYGLCRMYASMAEDTLDYEVQVFDNDLESAFIWARPSGKSG